MEDINQDYTLNEYERYYQYKVSIRPEDLNENNIGHNYLADVREVAPTLRNGNKETVHWYKFRIPLNSEDAERIGSISDFTSIRFMRMFLTNFKHPVVLRFGSLDLVRGEWRTYEQTLDNSASSSGTLETSAVNIEEHNDKQPVNYVLPPGISRVSDPSQPQLVENNEQALNMTVNNLSKTSRRLFTRTPTSTSDSTRDCSCSSTPTPWHRTPQTFRTTSWLCSYALAATTRTTITSMRYRSSSLRQGSMTSILPPTVPSYGPPTTCSTLT